MSILLLLQIGNVDFEMVSWCVHLPSRKRWSIFGWFAFTYVLKVSKSKKYLVFLVLFSRTCTKREIALYVEEYKVV